MSIRLRCLLFAISCVGSALLGGCASDSNGSDPSSTPSYAQARQGSWITVAGPGVDRFDPDQRNTAHGAGVIVVPGYFTDLQGAISWTPMPSDWQEGFLTWGATSAHLRLLRETGPIDTAAKHYEELDWSRANRQWTRRKLSVPQKTPRERKLVYLAGELVLSEQAIAKNSAIAWDTTTAATMAFRYFTASGDGWVARDSQFFATVFTRDEQRLSTDMYWSLYGHIQQAALDGRICLTDHYTVRCGTLGGVWRRSDFGGYPFGYGFGLNFLGTTSAGSMLFGLFSWNGKDGPYPEWMWNPDSDATGRLTDVRAFHDIVVQSPGLAVAKLASDTSGNPYRRLDATGNWVPFLPKLDAKRGFLLDSTLVVLQSDEYGTAASMRTSVTKYRP